MFYIDKINVIVSDNNNTTNEKPMDNTIDNAVMENDENFEANNEFRNVLSPEGIDRLLHSLRTISHDIHEHFIPPSSSSSSQIIPEIKSIMQHSNEHINISLVSNNNKPYFNNHLNTNPESPSTTGTLLSLKTSAIETEDFSNPSSAYLLRKNNSSLWNPLLDNSSDSLVTKNISSKDQLKEELCKKHPSLPPFGFGWFMIDKKDDDKSVSHHESSSLPKNLNNDSNTFPNLLHNTNIHDTRVSIPVIHKNNEKEQNNLIEKQKSFSGDSSILNNQTVLTEPLSDPFLETITNLRKSVQNLNNTSKSIFDFSNDNNNHHSNTNGEDLQLSHLTYSEGPTLAATISRNLISSTDNTLENVHPPIFSSSFSRSVPRPLSLRIDPTPRK